MKTIREIELEEKYNSILKDCVKLREEKIKYKQRIEKAISILENQDHNYEGVCYEVLNILKGEEK